MVVLSHVQAKLALEAKARGLQHTSLSFDLELSHEEADLDESGLVLPDCTKLGWDVLEEITKSPSSCFSVYGGEAHPIHVFSEGTQRAYSLFPTPGAPTMLVSGIPMHRIKDTEPHHDTLEKIRAIKPVVGQVLDTATGLGYTAIEAARTASHVTTIELDPAVLEICRKNPWSQGLFDNPKITQLIGDSFEVVARMEAKIYTRVIHDPPVISLAGDLYSSDFYRELHRIMRNQGMLYHYVGDPESKSGKNTTAGVIRRLEEVGFRQVKHAPRAFGVTAVK
jgi:predicted methyltransferase